MTAPAFVPVAMIGGADPGDQANAAVLGISRRRTIVNRYAPQSVSVGSRLRKGSKVYEVGGLLES